MHCQTAVCGAKFSLDRDSDYGLILQAACVDGKWTRSAEPAEIKLNSLKRSGSERMKK